MSTCKTCRWSCASMSKDNRKTILLCLHPKNGSVGKGATKECADFQRCAGCDEEELEGRD